MTDAAAAPAKSSKKRRLDGRPTSAPPKAKNGRSRVRPRVPVLTPAERRRLAGETLLDERTILAWERGERVFASTRNMLERAARKLRIPIPAKLPEEI